MNVGSATWIHCFHSVLSLTMFPRSFAFFRSPNISYQPSFLLTSIRSLYFQRLPKSNWYFYRSVGILANMSLSLSFFVYVHINYNFNSIKKRYTSKSLLISSLVFLYNRVMSTTGFKSSTSLILV